MYTSSCRYNEKGVFLLRRILRGLAATVTAAAAVLAGMSAPAALADEVTPMIVGGENASKSWAVSFQSTAEPGLPAQDGLWPSCGGTLITSQWVLTAAHCPERVLTYARVGTLNWRQGELIRVAQIIRHKDFNQPVGAQYDIALVKLAKPVTTKPVPIYIDGGVNSLSLAQGWGTLCDVDVTDFLCHETIPDRLQQLAMKQYASNSCEFPGAPEVFHGPSMLCLGSADGKPKGVCFGDSGGPILRMVGDRVYVIGIISGDADSYSIHPNLCSTAQNGGPGKMMATKVAAYIPWIITTLIKWDYRASQEMKQAQYDLAG